MPQEKSWTEMARQGAVVGVLADGRARVDLGDDLVEAAPSEALVARDVRPEAGQAALVRPTAAGEWEIARLHRFPEGREEPLLVPAEDDGVEYLVKPGEMRWQNSHLPYLYDWYDEFGFDLDMWRGLAREEGGPILELACGTGRVVIELLLEGHVVTGVDISQAMLDRAREKLAERAPDAASRVDLVRADMGQFRDDRRYALAYIACNSLHYMTPVEHRAAAIRTLHDHLRPGGLGVVSNVATLTAEPPKTRLPATHLVMFGASVNPNTGLWTVEYNGRWSDSLTGEDYVGPWRFVEEAEDGARRTFEFRSPPGAEPEPDPPPVLTRDDTVALMREAGFSDIEVRSAYDLGEPADGDWVAVFSGRA